MPISPTKNSLKALAEQGFSVAVTERWNPFAKRRVDLFGFIDLLAIRADTTIAVQTTSDHNMGDRLAKIKKAPAAMLWLLSPNRKIHIHGWSKQNRRWTVTVREVTLSDIVDHRDLEAVA